MASFAGRKFSSYKFRRQHRIGEYVLDFFCPEARYNIELDGSGHGFPAQRAEDEKRDAFLMERNIKVRRFWNNQLKEIQWVRETVWATAVQLRKKGELKVIRR